MNIVKSILISILFTGTSMNLMAEGKLQVLDQGMDGDTRYYLIICPNGEKNSITVKFDIDPATGQPLTESDLPPLLIYDGIGMNIKPPAVVEVCVHKGNGSYRCQGDINLDAAAETSCL